MRFALRYWTRRSVTTIAVPCTGAPDAIKCGADYLHEWANAHDRTVLGEAFLRFQAGGRAEIHLPVDVSEHAPCPPFRLGHVDHGRVVGAHEVGQADFLRVAQALTMLLQGDCTIIGELEYHFDPSVGRTEGIVVLPVNEHPLDKAAFVVVPDAATD